MKVLKESDLDSHGRGDVPFRTREIGTRGRTAVVDHDCISGEEQARTERGEEDRGKMRILRPGGECIR